MVTSSRLRLPDTRMVKYPQFRGELFSAAPRHGSGTTPAGHMDPKVKMRLGWVQFYQKTDNFSLTSRRCGISRPTLRKWVSRYQESGLEGLLDRSRRPKRCRPDKMNAQNRLWIGQLTSARVPADAKRVAAATAGVAIYRHHPQNSQTRGPCVIKVHPASPQRI